jgi:hypothetical protein
MEDYLGVAYTSPGENLNQSLALHDGGWACGWQHQSGENTDVEMPKDESQGQTGRVVVRHKKNRPFVNSKESLRNVINK